MEQRLQARAHYCDHKKNELYLPGVVLMDSTASRFQKTKKAIKSVATKTKLGTFAYSALKKIYVALYIPSIFRTRYYSNNKLGLYITASCNLSCHNCQVSARQAPSGDVLTLEQTNKIINDAIAAKYYWNQIFVTGGEPTLHPQFFEILDVVKRYVDFNPECKVTLETAGAGNKVQSILAKVPAWVFIRNTMKMESERDYGFVAYNVAPADSLRYSLVADFSKGCRRISDAYGLAATPYGYYPCTPCMNVDRVFGYNIGIKTLAEVSETTLREQMKTLCKNCGWFREEKISHQESTQQMSKSWKTAFEKYKTQRPILSKLQ